MFQPPHFSIDEIIDQLEQIQRKMVMMEHKLEHIIHGVDKKYRHSARNLIHYLTLRTFDLRPLQKQLSAISLSSFGHSEGYCLHNINQVLNWLYLYNSNKSGQEYPDILPGPVRFSEKIAMLTDNASRLLGHPKHDGHSRIMVTLPSEAATDYKLVLSLVQAGMDIARINTGHDNPSLWEKMIANVQKAAKENNTVCKIYMDIAGPKLRTGPIPHVPGSKKKAKNHYILVREGDILYLRRKQKMATLPKIDGDGQLIKPATLSTSLPEIFDSIREGENIWFDDGKIGATILSIEDGQAKLQITHAKENGSKLRAEKGINLPETNLALPPLTDYDEEVLPFICQHADMLGYSFIRTPKDIAYLQERLKTLNRPDIGVILKIETQEAFLHFPSLLLQAMHSQTVGVMIARGDLAVEIGWTRIAEVQEQIMWLCEAAHIPDIWATQVLESLAKKGTATRAEITDVATAVRAECIMLNKGPYIVDAVNTVTNIDHRMSAHQHKKKMAMRPLNVAQFFFSEESVTT